MTRHDRLPLWQHQISKICYCHNKVSWPVWILKAKQAALLLSHDTSRNSSFSTLIIICSSRLPGFSTWTIFKIIFIICPTRYTVLFIMHYLLGQIPISIVILPFSNRQIINNMPTNWKIKYPLVQKTPTNINMASDYQEKYPFNNFTHLKRNKKKE